MQPVFIEPSKHLGFVKKKRKGTLIVPTIFLEALNQYVKLL